MSKTELLKKEIEDLQKNKDLITKELKAKEEELRKLKSETEKTEFINKALFSKLENKIAELTRENKNLYEDYKKIQIDLQNSDRMISIGTVAGGIAREFNNMLLGPKLCAQDILKKDYPEEIKETLKDLLTYCDSGEKLLKTLITESEISSFQDVSINDILEDIVIMLNMLFEYENIEIIKNYSDIPKIMVKEQKLREAFVNLLLNARDDIKFTYESGEITITTKSNGEYVKIIISDTGEGISKECLREIFYPSSIVKGARSNRILPRLGSGLSRTGDIIHEHNGEMEVESQPGKGIIFTLWLPVKQIESEEEFKNE